MERLLLRRTVLRKGVKKREPTFVMSSVEPGSLPWVYSSYRLGWSVEHWVLMDDDRWTGSNGWVETYTPMCVREKIRRMNQRSHRQMDTELSRCTSYINQWEPDTQLQTEGKMDRKRSSHCNWDFTVLDFVSWLVCVRYESFVKSRELPPHPVRERRTNRSSRFRCPNTDRKIIKTTSVRTFIKISPHTSLKNLLQNVVVNNN